MTRIDFKMPVLFVDDIDRSRNFYSRVLGLVVENDFGENISFIDSISLWDKDKAKDIIFSGKGKFHGNYGKEIVELYFEADDIEKVSESVKKHNVKEIHGLREEPWGQRVLRFYDPDDFIIEIAEPMGSVVARLNSKGHDIEYIQKKTQLDIEIVKSILGI